MKLASISAALMLSAALIIATPAVAQKPDTKEPTAAAGKKTQVKDPVCGMMIDPATAAGKAQYKGKTYYFCSREEKAQFDKSPQTYIKAEASKSKKTS